MEKMLFTDQQPSVTITLLPDGKRDVRVLAREEIVIMENLTSQEESPAKTMLFQYDGNQFRTVHEISDKEIMANIEKYLHYSSENEPTSEQLQKEKDFIKNYEDDIMRQIEEAVNND